MESITAFLTKIEELNLEAKILKENLHLTLMLNFCQELQAALVELILDNPSYEI